jgi:hypothetical protein
MHFISRVVVKAAMILWARRKGLSRDTFDWTSEFCALLNYPIANVDFIKWGIWFSLVEPDIFKSVSQIPETRVCENFVS